MQASRRGNASLKVWNKVAKHSSVEESRESVFWIVMQLPDNNRQQKKAIDKRDELLHSELDHKSTKWLLSIIG